MNEIKSIHVSDMAYVNDPIRRRVTWMIMSNKADIRKTQFRLTVGIL